MWPLAEFELSLRINCSERKEEQIASVFPGVFSPRLCGPAHIEVLSQVEGWPCACAAIPSGTLHFRA